MSFMLLFDKKKLLKNVKILGNIGVDLILILF